MIDVRIDSSEVDELLEAIPGAFARARANALDDVGDGIARIARDCFTKRPDLRPAEWPPRKGKDDGRPLLIRSSVMWNAIRHEVTGPDTVRVGTVAEYAPYHQHGTKNMPARPFLPVGEDGELTPYARRTVERKVERAFEEELATLRV